MSDEITWFLFALICSSLGLTSIAGLIVILISDTKMAKRRRRRESMTKRSASLPLDEPIASKGKTNLGVKRKQNTNEHNKVLAVRTLGNMQKAKSHKKR